jgi:hypothetical protein
MIDLNRYYIAKTYDGVSGSYAGRPGFVPQAATGDSGKFLRADGSWAIIDTSNNEMSISGLDLTISSGNLVLSSPTGIPNTTGSLGIKGSFVWNTGHLYVCTNTNSWRRVALTTW